MFSNIEMLQLKENYDKKVDVHLWDFPVTSFFGNDKEGVVLGSILLFIWILFHKLLILNIQEPFGSKKSLWISLIKMK